MYVCMYVCMYICPAVACYDIRGVMPCKGQAICRSYSAFNSSAQLLYSKQLLHDLVGNTAMSCSRSEKRKEQLQVQLLVKR